MPRLSLTPQTAASTGKNFTALKETVIHTDGAQFANNGVERLVISNEGSGAADVTIVTPLLMDGNLAVAERVITIAQNAVWIVGPFARNVYNQPDNTVQVDTDIAGVKVMVLV